MPIHRDQEVNEELAPRSATLTGPTAILASPPANFTGPPYTSVGATILPSSTGPQAEQHIVSTLFAGDNTLIMTVSDFDDVNAGFNHTKYFISTDQGLTWMERYVPEDLTGLLLPTADGRLWKANSDPVVAVSRKGLVLLSNLYLLLARENENAADVSNGIYVSVTPLGSITDDPIFDAEHTFTVARSELPFDTRFNDKQWLAVDNDPNSPFFGRVYHAWCRFAGSLNAIRTNRSFDDGQTWRAPVKLSLDRHDGAVQGAQINCSPGGQVTVTWNVFGSLGRTQIWQVRSLQGGGDTWRAAHPISPIYFEPDFNSSYRKNPFSAVAVSPVNGIIHVVYSDHPTSAVGAQVNYIRSTDGGVTYSSPVRLNDINTGHQWMPAIHCDELGKIHVMWFDTRNSPSNSSK